MADLFSRLKSALGSIHTVVSDALAHRATTYASLVLGLTSLGESMQSVADASAQVAAVKGLPAVAVAHSAAFSLKLGAIAAVCLILASVGKSVVLKKPPTDDNPPADPGATQFLVKPGTEAASVTTQLTIVPKTEEEKKAA